jgi:hypothetical protein
MTRSAPSADTTPSAPSRRHLMKGIAWAAPAAAVAVAAPAMAASSPAACPTINAPADWTLTKPTYGVFKNGDAQAPVTMVRTGVYGNEFFQADESLDPDDYAQLTYATTMPVVAGTSYAFTFFAGANYGNYDSTTSVPAEIGLIVDGATIWTGNTREKAGAATLPNTAAATDDLSYGKYIVNYTATATGTVPVTLLFTAGGGSTATIATDDVYITVPYVDCP